MFFDFYCTARNDAVKLVCKNCEKSVSVVMSISGSISLQVLNTTAERHRRVCVPIDGDSK